MLPRKLVATTCQQQQKTHGVLTAQTNARHIGNLPRLPETADRRRRPRSPPSPQPISATPPSWTAAPNGTPATTPRLPPPTLRLRFPARREGGGRGGAGVTRVMHGRSRAAVVEGEMRRGGRTPAAGRVR